MADDNVLYFLAKRETYRYGKINALSAQSSILKSREVVKRLLELKEQEHHLKQKIVKAIASIRKDIAKFHKSLPKTRKQMPRRLVHPESLSKDQLKRAKRVVYKDEIRQELSQIEEKLRELGADVS